MQAQVHCAASALLQELLAGDGAKSGDAADVPLGSWRAAMFASVEAKLNNGRISSAPRFEAAIRRAVAAAAHAARARSPEQVAIEKLSREVDRLIPHLYAALVASYDGPLPIPVGSYLADEENEQSKKRQRTDASHDSSSLPSLYELLKNRTRGWRPQCLALMRHNPEHVSSGINDKHGKGEAALHLAADYGDEKIVSSILRLSGVDVDILTDNCWSPVDYAARSGHGSVVTVLERAGANPGVLLGSRRYGSDVPLLLDSVVKDANHDSRQRNEKDKHHESPEIERSHSEDSDKGDGNPSDSERAANADAAASIRKRSQNRCCHCCRTSFMSNPRPFLRCQSCPNAVCQTCVTTRPWLGLKWSQAEEKASKNEFECPACTGTCKCARCIIRYGQSKVNRKRPRVAAPTLSCSVCATKSAQTSSWTKCAGSSCPMGICSNCSCSSTESWWCASCRAHGTSDHRTNTTADDGGRTLWRTWRTRGSSVAVRTGIPVAQVPPRPDFGTQSNYGAMRSYPVHPLVRYDFAVIK